MKQKMASVPKENGQQKYQQIGAIVKPAAMQGFFINPLSTVYFKTSSISASPSSFFFLG